MEISTELLNLPFFILLLTWVLVEIVKQRRAGDGYQPIHGVATERKSTILIAFTLFANVLISILYLGYCFYEFWNLKTISFQSVILVLTWVLATVIVIYSKNREFPLILLSWWVFSGIIGSLSLSLFLINLLKPIKYPNFLLKIDAVDYASFPFTILLCFNLLPIDCSSKKQRSDIKKPLLLSKEEDLSKNNAFSEAGIWSQLSFQWLNALFEKGRIQKLELTHIPSLPKSERADRASSLLEESLGKQRTEATSVPRAIIHTIWRPLIINAIFAGTNTIASYMGPFLITNFVNSLSRKPDASSHNNGLILAFILFFAKTVESLSQRQWYFGAQRVGIQIRAALMVLVYKKSLSIKYTSPSTGKIINFINADIEKIGEFCLHIHEVWLLPFQVFLALLILYRNLGAIPSIAALFTTVLIMVSNTPLAKRQKRLHSKIMEAKDSRIKSTSETLKSMRVLKLHSWESTFLKSLLQLREIERSWLKRYLYTCSAVAFLFWASPTMVSVITFGACITLKTPLSPGAVFSALATIRALGEPIYNLPELISMIAQTKVSLDRIQEFIMEEDLDTPITNKSLEASDIAIEIEDGEYTWEINSKKPTIQITERMKIWKGYKVAICGSVGSGKSSLLCGMLGEISRMSGAGIKVYGSKAYVPQSAWIQTGTVRDNVLFGNQMNEQFYEAVLDACALNQDVLMWADRDLSVVGERGMKLSGGQKQRIQLARAIYSDSDVYFLDDPFSAVDAHTGAHLFKKCLFQLLSNKTVVYVIHQLEFLHASDLVLVMKDGRIVQSGKYEALMQDHHSELVRLMDGHIKSLRQVNPLQEHNVVHEGNEIEMTEKNFECPISRSNISESNNEETETGRVKWPVYSMFVTSAYRGALAPVILLCQALFQGLQMGSNYWIAWATEEEGRVSKEHLIAIFALMSGWSSIFMLGRTVLLSTIALKAAQSLFLGMTTSIFRAPMSFFDYTPSSQILNRSSKDQSTVDTDIPYRLAGLAFALIQLFSIIILMCMVYWKVSLLFIAVIVISIWYQAYYITTARELARMIGTRKAPILHHFSESISGAATIRCFNQEDNFFLKNLNLIDNYSCVAFHNSATMEWLSVRINFLFNFSFFIVLMILVTLPSSSIDPSLAGLAATFGLNLNVLQAWVIWNLCNVENKMISVERILQFSKIPSEAPLVIETCRPEPKWPINGRIELENLHVRYSPALPVVLRGISCTFPGGKKIGVVGRTGCGKSTLVQALFRVVEPSEGRILIDGLDICKIGLQDLRSSLSIIPQDPTLFQGTMRTNIDPLQQHSDQEIWEVLKKCHLAEIVRHDERLLSAPVAEDGGNWSVGQRQLVCLARVLLQNRRILVLDEATAAVDTATDNVIQKTIREETIEFTVITVAHRIPTIIDNDLVLVLDEGKTVDYDSPTQLLKDNSSAFSKLVTEFLRRSSKSDCHLNLNGGSGKIIM